MGAILAPIQIIIPFDDSEEEEEEEEEEEKPKKKKKKKGPKKADKVRNLTLSLGEALSLIMKEEVDFKIYIFFKWDASGHVSGVLACSLDALIGQWV